MRHGHEVRIIGGQWKRSRLPVADRAGLRPTPDRVRETLFNWLGQDLQGWRCIDAFAGAGALGFEAASRGAAKVWMIERDAALVGSLKRVQERLSATSVQVDAGDGVAALQRTPPHSWDLIFLDPPYDSGLLPKALTASQRALAPEGLLYLESAQAWPECLAPQALGRAPGQEPVEAPQQAQWTLLRHLKAGQVHAHLLRPATLSSDEEKIP